MSFHSLTSLPLGLFVWTKLRLLNLVEADKLMVKTTLCGNGTVLGAAVACSCVSQAYHVITASTLRSSTRSPCHDCASLGKKTRQPTDTAVRDIIDSFQTLWPEVELCCRWDSCVLAPTPNCCTNTSWTTQALPAGGHD